MEKIAQNEKKSVLTRKKKEKKVAPRAFVCERNGMRKQVPQGTSDATTSSSII